MIAPELDKPGNQVAKTLFDNMGSTCYAIAAEVGSDIVIDKRKGMVVHDLQLDTAQMRAMGGRYIIAGLPIENHEAIGLHFVQLFSSPEDFIELYLYEI
jgi:hypothetical protein